MSRQDSPNKPLSKSESLVTAAHLFAGQGSTLLGVNMVESGDSLFNKGAGAFIAIAGITTCVKAIIDVRNDIQAHRNLSPSRQQG